MRSSYPDQGRISKGIPLEGASSKNDLESKAFRLGMERARLIAEREQLEKDKAQASQEMSMLFAQVLSQVAAAQQNPMIPQQQNPYMPGLAQSAPAQPAVPPGMPPMPPQGMPPEAMQGMPPGVDPAALAGGGGGPQGITPDMMMAGMM